MSGYNIFRKDRPDSYGGVAIIIHKSLHSQISPIHLSNPGIKIIHIKILNCISLKNIISIYCPSSVVTRAADWDSLFDLKLGNTLIAGDFNAHHTNWSYKIDQRGTQLLESSLENGWISLNNGDATRVKLVNGLIKRTSPDITFASSDISVNCDWKVFNENLGTDHLIIKIALNYLESKQYIKKRNFKKSRLESL